MTPIGAARVAAAAAMTLFAAIVPDRPAHAQTVPVALELVLAVDISASVDAGEYRLQMQGIADALRDPEIIAAIEGFNEAGVALTLVQWSALAHQALDWRLLAGGADARAMAAEIARLERPGLTVLGVTTGIGSALSKGLALIDGNAFDGRRRVIDVSGDGKNNSGLPLAVQRGRAVLNDIVVNGLAITEYDPSLKNYYRDHVIAGPGAFVLTADDFGDFARAFREKLLRELRAPMAGTRAPVQFARAR